MSRKAVRRRRNIDPWGRNVVCHLDRLRNKRVKESIKGIKVLFAAVVRVGTVPISHD